MMLVHAHPDDEVTGTGATMAQYASEGVQVTLVTCTLGEEGEVLVPALSHLAAAEGDQLGGYRYYELSRAMGEIALEEVFAQLPNLQLDPGRELQVKGWRFRGVTDLPATWQA